MRAPVGDGASRVVEPPAEGLMAALLEILHLRRLAEPQVPMKAVRHRLRLERAVAQAGRHEHRHLRELADPAVAHELAREPEQPVAALLRAGLQHDTLLAHRFDEALALVDRVGQRLLRVDVLPGAGSREVDERMPVIGRRVDDDVHVLPLEHLAEVGELRGSLVRAGELFRRGRGVVLVDVADRDEVAEAHGALRVAAAHPAAADERDPRAIVGAQRGWGLRGGRQLLFDEPTRQPRGGGDRRAMAEERSTGDVDGHEGIERQSAAECKRVVSRWRKRRMCRSSNTRAASEVNREPAQL